MGGRDVATIQPPFSILPKKEGVNDVSAQDVVIENTFHSTTPSPC
jgi:hypothetical protein